MNEMLGNRPLVHKPDSRWRRREKLRHGYTTAACAAAAAAGATYALLGKPVADVTLDLPGEKQVTFALVRCERSENQVTCGIIKDAGDDPDVTHGLEICATVSWSDAPGITLAGGEGVGIVTRPGLPVPMGEPAINPGPRRLIVHAVQAAAGSVLATRGLHVLISVPRGQAVAQETLNPRLGIVGGISILGASGIVKPYSNASYRATIRLALTVACKSGLSRAVLATGKRSEEYAQRRYPTWPEMAFVQVGDHMDYALTQARRLRFSEIVIATMIGKASKLAQGRLQTHVSEGTVDLGFLADVAGGLGAAPDLQAAIREANTAHYVQNLVQRAGIEDLERRVAQMAAEQAAALCPDARIEVLIHSLDGALLGVGEWRSKP